MPVTPYNSMPVGSIVPYAGDATQSGNILSLVSAGWMPCDGSLVSVTQYPDLYAVIGTVHGGSTIKGVVVRFRLPDLRDLYPRGVTDTTTRDPDASTRTAPYEGAETGNEVGSVQPFATAAPRSPFVTDSQGAHTHTVENVTTTYHNAYAGSSRSMAHVNGGATVASGSSGAHTHTVLGGDTETRPVSLTVSWIIRWQAST